MALAVSRGKRSIACEAAAALVAAALAEAARLGAKVSVAVLDEGGNLVAFGRMDDAPLIGIEASRRKAYTALLGLGTEALAKVLADRDVKEGLVALGSVTMLPGGLPIRDASTALVGAIGVSGGSPEQDVAIAEAALRLIA